MALEDACRELEPIAAVLVAEADLCAQIAAGVDGGWDNELSTLSARTMASGIAQWATLLRPLQMEAIAMEQEGALVS